MHDVRHWTPRYIYNRTRLMWCEHAHPDDPWLTQDAVRLLTSMLRSSDQGVEFGSGRSTTWFARRVNRLTSVEHDEQWYTTVSTKLKCADLVNVEYLLKPRDQPGNLGCMSSYVMTALSFADESVDFTLIDGIYRDHVTKLMITKIKPGGLLIIDNINRFLPSGSRAPGSRVSSARPDGPIWSEVACILADWRTIWTSSGVTDTAIFIKP